MPWPLPQPADISDRASGVYEAEYARIWALLNPGAPPAVVDARSPISTLAVHARVVGVTGFDLYLMQSRYGQELMPDSAVDWLSRHGAIWGVPQIQPAAAAGNLVLYGVENTVVPADLAFSAPGLGVYETINTGTIGSSGTISVGISAAVAGSAGDLPASTVLGTVNPYEGLITQNGTADSNGITGGQDIEATDHWRARILARIRQRGGGGDANDFGQWTQEVLPGALVYAFSPGVGLITVAIATPTGTGVRVPTTTELSEATAYLNDASHRKPLGAPVVNVIAATLQPVNFTLHLLLDTTAIRQAIINALSLYFAGGDIDIGNTLDVSRSDAAISLATPSGAFDRSVPSADVAPSTVTSILTLGSVAFV